MRSNIGAREGSHGVKRAMEEAGHASPRRNHVTWNTVTRVARAWLSGRPRALLTQGLELSP